MGAAFVPITVFLKYGEWTLASSLAQMYINYFLLNKYITERKNGHMPFNRFVSSKDFILLYCQSYKTIDSMLHKMSVCFVYFCLILSLHLLSFGEATPTLKPLCLWDTHKKIKVCNKVVLIEFTDTSSFNQFCQLKEIHKNHTDNTSLSWFHLLTLVETSTKKELYLTLIKQLLLYHYMLFI